MKATRTPGRILILLGIGASLLLAQPVIAAKDRYETGETVPVFTLKVLNKDESGETYVSLDKYYGTAAKDPKKAILLSFFATYCGPCKKEIPYLSALYDSYRDRGLQVLLITIDKEGPKIDEARELANQAEVKFPVLTDRFNIVARRFFIEKLPCVYVLNSDGKVSMVNVGYGDTAGRDLLDEIRKQLGEPVSDPIPERIQSFLAKDAHAGPAGGDGGADTAAKDDAGKGADADGETDNGADAGAESDANAGDGADADADAAATDDAKDDEADSKGKKKNKKKNKNKKKKRKKKK